MQVDLNPASKFKLNRFSKLGVWYILALSAIATVAIVGQILIQHHLQNQLSDSRVVNIAGTQRYKSQWIVKMAMLLYTDINHKDYPDKIEALEKLLEEWKRGHYALQRGDQELKLPPNNSEQIRKMFSDIEPYFIEVYTSTHQIINYKKADTPDTTALGLAVRTLLENETAFLKKMDDIVFQYDFEARQKVYMLTNLEYILLAIFIIVIVLEFFFIFRPTTLQVNQTINQLTSSEKNARKLSKEIGALYASLEKSYEQISIVNQPAENPRLYAKSDKGGNVTFITELFEDFIGKNLVTEGQRLSDLFPGMDHPDDWMDEVVEVISDGGTWQGEIHFQGAKNQDCWVAVIITPIYQNQNDIDELLMMGSDITQRKLGEQNMNLKNRAEIEKKINQQKFRSVLILEGQEEERKRIAMDIHDGIGQMLTSLKFQIESINLTEMKKAEQKIGEIQQLTKDVIKEVRRVTFNLKPTVLGDFGLQAALQVFVQEIGKLIDIKLHFHTAGEIDRLPQKIENNIFRIIQEAINNAIKYSAANAIQIILNQSDYELSVTVKDDGKGFDIKLVEARNMNIDSGRGFFNMYERTEYLNGSLTINSDPGKGTTVILSVPVRSALTVED